MLYTNVIRYGYWLFLFLTGWLLHIFLKEFPYLLISNTFSIFMLRNTNHGAGKSRFTLTNMC